MTLTAGIMHIIRTNLYDSPNTCNQLISVMPTHKKQQRGLEMLKLQPAQYSMLWPTKYPGSYRIFRVARQYKCKAILQHLSEQQKLTHCSADPCKGLRGVTKMKPV